MFRRSHLGGDTAQNSKTCLSCGWPGGWWFIRTIMPLRGSILQAGTCQILSLAENPRWSRVWQQYVPLQFYLHARFLWKWWFHTIFTSFKVRNTQKFNGNITNHLNSVIQAQSIYKILKRMHTNLIIHDFSLFSAIETEIHANLNFVLRWKFWNLCWKPSESS